MIITCCLLIILIYSSLSRRSISLLSHHNFQCQTNKTQALDSFKMANESIFDILSSLDVMRVEEGRTSKCINYFKRCGNNTADNTIDHNQQARQWQPGSNSDTKKLSHSVLRLHGLPCRYSIDTLALEEAIPN